MKFTILLSLFVLLSLAITGSINAHPTPQARAPHDVILNPITDGKLTCTIQKSKASDSPSLADFKELESSVKKLKTCVQTKCSNFMDPACSGYSGLCTTLTTEGNAKARICALQGLGVTCIDAAGALGAIGVGCTIDNHVEGFISFKWGTIELLRNK